jgi:uncharacterized protein (DUF1697 family)
MSDTRYIAFLRGINVGGHHKITMLDLKKMFEKIDMSDVQTVLASGNVLFKTTVMESNKLQKKVEESLKSNLGYPVTVIIRTREQIHDLVRSAPFSDIKTDADTRLYVSFLSTPSTKSVRINSGYFQIISVSDTEVCSVLQLNPKMGSTDGMNILEKHFGKEITTRNWNTVVKIANLLQ